MILVDFGKGNRPFMRPIFPQQTAAKECTVSDFGFLIETQKKDNRGLFPPHPLTDSTSTGRLPRVQETTQTGDLWQQKLRLQNCNIRRTVHVQHFQAGDN